MKKAIRKVPNNAVEKLEASKKPTLLFESVDTIDKNGKSMGGKIFDICVDGNGNNIIGDVKYGTWWAIIDRELCCAPMEQDGTFPRDNEEWSDWASVEDMTDLTIGYLIELNELMACVFGYKIVCEISNFRSRSPMQISRYPARN